ncbi:MAG: putative glycoside hydrolase [Anaerolineae bacterium]|nr:putative glycoside hydrolase [Anaerolineae bacterium]MDW8102739.1 putative glycoside hydrolase [Anaerolineae bacterium]
MKRAISSLFLTLLSSIFIAITAWLAGEVGLEIVVTDREGRPLEATISLDGKKFRATGSFNLRTRRGEHPVEVQAPGYRTFKGKIKVTLFSFNPPLHLTLEPLILEGKIQDELDGSPVGYALIRGENFSLKAGPDGRFRLEKPSLPLSLSISADGYEELKVAFRSEEELFSPQTFFLRPNRVEGFVTDAFTGLPLAKVLVHTADWESFSDEHGRFTLRRVVKGEEIYFKLEGYFSTTLSFTGTEAATLRVALRPELVLVRVVEKFTLRPLPGAEVHCGGVSFLTDEKGEVLLPAPADGEIISASSSTHASAYTTFKGEETIVLELPSLVWGAKIRDASTGEPISGAWVYIAGKRFGPSWRGELKVEGVPPEGEITVKAPGYTLLRVNPSHGDWERDSPALNLSLEPFQVRGIYIPFVLLARPDRVKELLELVDKTELNAIVVDVKSDRGFLAWDSQVPLARELGIIRERESKTLQEILRFCREKGIYTIARIVVFKDNPLATGRPDLAVRRKDGTVWLDREELGWGNPFRREVWDYNIALAKEVASMGFDEINLDYIRFPSDGDLGAIAWEETNTLETRTEAIREFIKAISEALAPLPVFLSADVFGLTPWVEGGGDMGIGQRIEDISPYVDYLCPMVYPSTFAPGALGYENPALHPYDVVYRSTLKARERSKALVRPWLQHYSLYGVTYTLEQFKAQRRAAEEAGAWGWLWWNAGGFYEEALFTREE